MDEKVACGDQRDGGLLGGRDDEGALVVGGQDVGLGVLVGVGIESHAGEDGVGFDEFEDDAAGRGGLDPGGVVHGGGWQVDLADGAGDAVDDELGVDGSLDGIGGLHAHEDGELGGVLVVAFGSECDQPDVVGGRCSDGVVLECKLALDLIGADALDIGDSPVGVEVEEVRVAALEFIEFEDVGDIAVLVGVIDEPVGALGLGEPVGLFDGGGRVGLLDAVDRVPEDRLVAAELGDDFGAGVEGDDHGLVGFLALGEDAGGAHRFDQVDGVFFGLREAGLGAEGLGAVDRGHGCGAIDEDEVLASLCAGGGAAWLGEGEEDEGEDDELEEEEEVFAEALEGGVGLQVLDGLLPEECG